MASDIIPKPGAVPAASKAKPVEAEVKAPKKIAVKAIEKGFYGNSRKNPGDKFFIENEKHFSEHWMEKI